jgi:hypothetical protein
MTPQNINISPKTKIGELLDNFPQLEAVLLEMSPAFGKLKNPVLRKTVARVATLQQVAVIGGLKVDDIVNRLRTEAGQSEGSSGGEEPDYLSASTPAWFETARIIKSFDATPVINSGGSPMNEILQETKGLDPGEIYELKTPFVPAPIIDMLKTKGFRVYIIQKDSSIISYVCR